MAQALLSHVTQLNPTGTGTAVTPVRWTSAKGSLSVLEGWRRLSAILHRRTGKATALLWVLATCALFPTAHSQVPLTGISTVAMGSSHTCALTSSGAVQCWGRGINGQLGDNTATQRLTPVAVSGLSSGVTAIAAGQNHTCAITGTGAVQCWGTNSLGQLGDGSTTQRNAPVPVSGLGSGVTAIAVGGAHTCALLSTGAVQCWGFNAQGQLGDGTNTNSLTPVPVSGLGSGVTAIAAGAAHTCAILSTGAALCWGSNAQGQLGDGSTTNSSIPVAVSGLSSGVTDIEGGDDHTCARLSTGAVQCWGRNFDGQLGDGSTTNRSTPVAVSGLSSGVAGIAVGSAHTCARLSTGAVQCWGNNAQGQLGDTTSVSRSTPVAVFGLSSGVAGIAVGSAHTCARLSTGAVQCWGNNAQGQLGDNSTSQPSTPVAVAGLSSGVTAITVGSFHTCARLSTGAVQCWGNNAQGQLGDNSTTQRLTPVAVSGLSSGVAAIATGAGHTCALLSTGAVQCWGLNSNGQLGDTTSVSRSTPVAVFGLSSGVAAIAAGNSHTCALLSSGAVQCWGLNVTGQLGDGTNTDRNTPVPVSGLSSGVTAISAGINHTCALLSTGAVQCWGNNGDGQLGDGTQTQRLTPVAVSGLSSGVAAIAVGGSHTCARLSTGAVQCWGRNIDRQLGDNSTTRRLTPVAVSGLSSGVAAIAAGNSHTCAVLSSGAARCWGTNNNGQLGDGTFGSRRSIPAPVLAFTAPDAPTMGTATAGNAEATVTFTAPTSDGGSAITSYTATSTPGSVAGTCTAPCTSITVTGLTNGTGYTFTVTATNAIGTGTASAASNSVTPVAPGCSVGSFSATGLPPCTTAPAGSYVSTTGATAPTLCPAGTYNPNTGSTASAACLNASAGSFAAGTGNASQSLCPAGTFSATAGAATCTPAPAGSFAAGTGNTASTLCAVGSFTAAPGQTSCTSAPAGSFVSAAGASVSTSCAAGTFQPLTAQTSCTAAPAGSFAAGTGNTAASPCASGSFTATAGQASCTQAPAGSFVAGTGNTGSTLCAVGSFTATSGQASCTPAPAGSIVSTTGATSATPCAAGSFVATTGQSVCTAAPAGSFAAGTGNTAATPCPAGTFSASAGTATCTQAPAGSFVAGTGNTGSTLCAVGTFTAAPGQTSCTPAPAGSFAAGTGNTVATLCAAGSFTATAGQASCTPAPAGSFVAGTGETSATVCPAGTFSASAGAATCTQAPAGSFVSGTGNTGSTLCAVGTFTAAPGQTSCTPAPAGSFAAGTGNTVAPLCAAGSFTATAGQASCTPAPAGSFVAGTGETSATVCPAGTFSASAGQSACGVAPAGSFVGATGATSATLCPAGSFASAASSSACTLAPAGSFAAGTGNTSATLCAAGSFTATAGQTSCTLAAVGSFVASAGATSQTACASGTTTIATGQTSCLTIQTITFNPPASVNGGSPPITLVATGGASGNPVTFASQTTSVCTTSGLNGSTLTFLATGTCTVRAAQAGNVTFLAATNVDRNISVANPAPPPPPPPPTLVPSNAACVVRGAGVVNCSVAGSTTGTGGVQTAAITGYQVYCRDVSGAFTINQTYPGGNFTLPTLPPGRSYSCQVTATSSSGPSSPVDFQIAPQVTPLALRGQLDFDGRGFANLFLRGLLPGASDADGSVKSTSATTQLARWDGAKFVFTTVADIGGDWTVLGAGDVTGTGVSSLISRNVATNVRVDQTLPPINGTVVRNARPDWVVEAVSDLDGDGKADILWRYLKPGTNDSGVTFAWFMDGNQTSVSVNEVKHRGGAPLSWSLIGVSDLDGDLRGDIVWVSPTGQIRALLGQADRTWVNTLVGQVPAGYTILRLGDVDGDGKGDIVMRNSEGNVRVWLMNGVAVKTIHDLPTTDKAWQFYGAGDFDGDGRMDLAWVRPDQGLVAWLIDPTNVAAPRIFLDAGMAPVGLVPLEP